MAYQFLLYPLLICGASILTSIIGTFFVKLGANGSIMGALYKGLTVAGILALIAYYPITTWLIPDDALGAAFDAVRSDHDDIDKTQRTGAALQGRRGKRRLAFWQQLRRYPNFPFQTARP